LFLFLCDRLPLTRCIFTLEIRYHGLVYRHSSCEITLDGKLT
jgi:hypothetical protein